MGTAARTISQKDPLHFFGPKQKPEQNPLGVKVKLQKLVEYMKFELDFTLAFSDGLTSSRTGEALEGHGTTITVSVDGKPRLYVHLDYAMVIPLLQRDLTDAEKMGCEWFLANTLVHEMMVCSLIFNRGCLY